MTMTRQEQLDAMVRNYGEWEGDEPFPFVVFEGDDCHYVTTAGPFSINDGGTMHGFTLSEVEARKAELQNKPSWKDAPINAESLIQSEGGDWEWMVRIENLAAALPRYELEPQYSGYSGEVIGDWRDTLEKRPATRCELIEIPLEEAIKRDFEGFEIMDIKIGHEDVKSQHAPEEWNGEGLPPVGIECSVQLAFNDMGKCKITYIGDGVFCYRQLSSGNEYTGSISDTVFRPIQTDREKWMGAALHVEAEMHDSYQPHELLQALYDEGLGKMPD